MKIISNKEYKRLKEIEDNYEKAIKYCNNRLLNRSFFHLIRILRGDKNFDKWINNLSDTFKLEYKGDSNE